MRLIIGTISHRLAASALLTGMLVAGCDDGTTNATSATVASTAGAAAAINFTKTSHDFGVITDTRKHELRFPFTNSGGGQLVIEQVKGDCGCTVPTLSRKVFPPGDGDVIEVVFDPKGKRGPEDRKITVISNAGQKTVELKFKADIRPMLDFETMYQFGPMPLHEEHRREVPMRYTDPDLKIKALRTNNPAITARMISTGVADGQRDGQDVYRTDVALTVADDAPWGVLFANKLFLDVTGRPEAGAQPIDYTYTMSLMGMITGELKAQPTILSLGNLQLNKDFEKSTVLTRTTGEPFTIIDTVIADSTMPGIQVRVEPAGVAAHRITVYGNIGGYRGWVRGKLAIQTDIASEGILTIPISGLVK